MASQEPGISSPAPLVPSQKRVLDAVSEPHTPSRPVTIASCSPLSVRSLETPSPLKAASLQAADDASQPAAKRRRLTEQEKEEHRLEKEAKTLARAEKRAQKDEEKRKKDAEKEGKKRAREVKLQQEEEEKRRKDEEKQKKERSQLRLNSFFSKPKAAEFSKPAMVDIVQDPCTEQISLLPDSECNANLDASAPQKALNDYERFFLPFSLPPHAVLAPDNGFVTKHSDLGQVRADMDSLFSNFDAASEPQYPQAEQPHLIFPSTRRGCMTISIAQIVDLVNGSATSPVDLTREHHVKTEKTTTQKPLDLLDVVPMKYLHFPEDVRPPYFGTYTRPHPKRVERIVAVKPTTRALEDLNYDYDSEAEWEEPEEGEDLGSEGEEDLDEEGDDEMDGFLDDENDLDIKRRMLASSDQEPVSTGLCWENELQSYAIGEQFRMSFLLDEQCATIDPYSTAYWAFEPAQISNNKLTHDLKNTTKQGSMNPPRLPLSARPVNGLLNTLNILQPPSLDASNGKGGKPKRMIPPEDLAAFKTEVEGQDLTKLGMIEALKKKFPKLPKDAITNTLTAVAKRVGPSEKEKRWVLLA